MPVGQQDKNSSHTQWIPVSVCFSVYNPVGMLGEEIKVLPLLRKTPTFPRKICICTFSVKLRQQRGGSEFFLSVWEFQSLTYISHLSLLFKGCRVKDISLFVIATSHHTPERRNDSHRCDQLLCFWFGKYSEFNTFCIFFPAGSLVASNEENKGQMHE